jgi:hypothetical protein
MIDKHTQHSEGMYRGGPKSRKRRIQIFIILYIVVVIVSNTVFSGEMGSGHLLFGIIISLLIRDDIAELRAQNITIGFIRFAFYIFTVVIPVSSLLYLLYRMKKTNSTN